MKTLVLARGGFFRRYARVSRLPFGGHTGDPRYYFWWQKVVASAGFFSDAAAQDIYVWSTVHNQWYRVLIVRERDA